MPTPKNLTESQLYKNAWPATEKKGFLSELNFHKVILKVIDILLLVGEVGSWNRAMLVLKDIL